MCIRDRFEKALGQNIELTSGWRCRLVEHRSELAPQRQMQQRRRVDAQRRTEPTAPTRRTALCDRKVREAFGCTAADAFVNRGCEAFHRRQLHEESSHDEMALGFGDRVQRPRQHRVERGVGLAVLRNHFNGLEHR